MVKVGITSWSRQSCGKTEAAYLCDKDGKVVDTVYSKIGDPCNQWTHSGKPIGEYEIAWEVE